MNLDLTKKILFILSKKISEISVIRVSVFCLIYNRSCVFVVQGINDFAVPKTGLTSNTKFYNWKRQ